MRHKPLQVNISDDAGDMQREIFFYTADEWDVEQARTYDDLFVQAYEKIALNPALGHAHPDIQGKYFVYQVGSHLVVYFTDSRMLHILAILHQNMNISRRLNAALQKMNLH